jgi:tetratricopeptide (TPR) repeat protein
MSKHNEKVQPVAFDAAVPPPEQVLTPATDTALRPPWLIPALLGLAVLAAIVFFWLPSQVGPASTPPAVEPGSAQDEPRPAIKPETDTRTEASPWSDAQLAKLRKEAQDALSELLEIQALLEDTGVELWASEAYEAAKALAGEGDAQYRERQFIEAKASYESGRDAMRAILETTDPVLLAQLQTGRDAIDALDGDSARLALEIATAIEPGNAELAALKQREATLEQIIQLLAEADTAEQRGELAKAEDSLKNAVTLDPEHKRVISELARVSAAHTSMRFNRAMSDGYQALDEGQFDSARKFFRLADQLSPGSTEAASALQEVQATQTAHRLADLQTRGQAMEAKEQWQQAVEAYEQAANIDSNILFAQEGLARSRSRAKLDKQFTLAINEPDRMSDPAVAEATAVLLRQAAAISPRGPDLDRQINTLQGLLQQANTPLPVTLRSDGETEVILYKVARLGLFQQQQLKLRPGTYTAVGTRNGYRDVRVTFVLSHSEPVPPVMIRCTEQI